MNDPVPDPIDLLRQADDAALEARWRRLEAWFLERFERTPGLEHILFLIGVQTGGRGYEPEVDRDTKQDVIMDGTFTVFESLGLYVRVGMEADGRWIWERTTPLPTLSIEQQEKLLRIAILHYFDEILDDRA